MKTGIALATLALLGVLGVLGCGGSGGPAGSNEVRIDVTDAGFVPANKTVKKGQPVTLVFTRKTNETCATDVVFASLHKGFDLPLNTPVRVELAANEVGDTLNYSCSMNMITGRLIAR